MNSKEWQRIEQAAQVLGLGDHATLAEIKRAFHRLCKLHHPDTALGNDSDKMIEITAAYEVLSRYCHDFRYPLRQDYPGASELDIHDPEDWWQARFGQDPVWCGNRSKKR